MTAQASQAAYFNGFGCAPAAYSFVTQAAGGPIYGNPVFEYGSNDDEQAQCIAAKAGAIGVVDLDLTPVAGMRFIKLDGVDPTKVNAALGKYGFWMESVFNKGGAIALNANGLLLANALIARSTVAADIPIVDQSFALYNGGVNTPVIPPSATRPIALATRGGNSCLNPQGQN